ncbi:hypothetical protein TNCV_3321821 [Trichonephila clavipes]|nr:hypothetical protein TNCV_3321821 [Trichonephila clavipes]
MTTSVYAKTTLQYLVCMLIDGVLFKALSFRKKTIRDISSRLKYPKSTPTNVIVERLRPDRPTKQCIRFRRMLSKTSWKSRFLPFDHICEEFKQVFTAIVFGLSESLLFIHLLHFFPAWKNIQNNFKDNNTSSKFSSPLSNSEEGCENI